MLDGLLEILLKLILSADLLREIIQPCIDLLEDLAIFDLNRVYYSLVLHHLLNEELLEYVAFHVPIKRDSLYHSLAILILNI